MSKARDDDHELARSAGLLQTPAAHEAGVLEIVDRMTDVLGERAVVALVRYAAEATVMDRLDVPHPGKGHRSYVLQTAARVSQSSLHPIVDREDGFEVEARPGPALHGVRPTLVAAICQGAVEGAFRSMFRSPTAQGQVLGASDGRLRIRVGRK